MSDTVIEILKKYLMLNTIKSFW